MNKFLLSIIIVLVLFEVVSANCGCLKCSQHLEGVDVIGPNGRPIKVVFEKQKPCGCCCQTSGKRASSEAANVYSKNELNFRPGQKYSVNIEQPRPIMENKPEFGLLKNNLKYVTHTVVVPPLAYSSSNPILSGNVANWLKANCPKEARCCQTCRLGNRINNNKNYLRRKRDLRKSDFLTTMLPQFIGEPLYHSVRGLKPDSKFLMENWKNPFKRSKFLANYRSLNTLSPRIKSQQSPANKDEVVLLKKLKKLNNNPFSSNLEEQATDYVKKLLLPNKRRSKRTIIVGSDEIDLPPHYKVTMEEDGDFSEENSEEIVGVKQQARRNDEDGYFFEENDEGIQQKTRKKLLERFQAKPDLIMGKSLIQKAVRDELNNYHRKMERDQKLKSFHQQQHLVPKNPMFLLLTAPMQFLKQFRNFNGPIMTTLPRMVHTAKKCFKDIGKNVHKHCLNLASNVIGDFDHVDPGVVDRLANGARFRRASDPATPPIRQKRYVIKVVDDDEMQDQLEEFLTKKMDGKFSYLKPLQEYRTKMDEFWRNHKKNEDYAQELKKNNLRITKVKPRIIIDNRGLPFMEYDGFKRPLLLKSAKAPLDSSSIGNSANLALLIARAKESGRNEIVGNSARLMPKQIVKERISSLLEEIDQLVHLNPDDYEDLFGKLLKMQENTVSIERKWKKLLMDNKIDDLNERIDLLASLNELQQIKDETMPMIGKILENQDNEFLRKHLINVLTRLQRLQCLVGNVAIDFEQHLKTKSSFNAKREIKYVDYLAELKFANAKTKSEMSKRFCRNRDSEGQKNIEMLNKLKKLLIDHSSDNEKFDKVSQLIWEMKNLEKLQKDTVKDFNRQLNRNSDNVKKELKILFDLQNRFEDCDSELKDLLSISIKDVDNNNKAKKDIKDVMAEIKRKHQEMLRKVKGRAIIEK